MESRTAASFTMRTESLESKVDMRGSNYFSFSEVFDNNETTDSYTVETLQNDSVDQNAESVGDSPRHESRVSSADSSVQPTVVKGEIVNVLAPQQSAKQTPPKKTGFFGLFGKSKSSVSFAVHVITDVVTHCIGF